MNPKIYMLKVPKGLKILKNRKIMSLQFIETKQIIYIYIEIC